MLEHYKLVWNTIYSFVCLTRYTLEYDKGLKPGGDTYATNEQPPPAIPPGYYDVGDGFYEPITRTVYKYDDLTGIVRCVVPFDVCVNGDTKLYRFSSLMNSKSKGPRISVNKSGF